MKVKSKAEILWDDFHVNLYGPSDLQRNQVANRCVKVLMNQLARAIRQCLKATAKQSPVLNRFRVEVEK